MDLLAALIIGIFVGWLATVAIDKPDALNANLITGLVGAISGYVVSLLLGNGVLLFSWLALFLSFVGALTLTIIINLFRIYPHRQI